MLAKLKIAGVRGAFFSRYLLTSATRMNDTKPNNNTFNEGMLQYLVCPLAKTPLRYDKEKQQLINDELGVIYPIQNGIPNLLPQDAEKVDKNKT